jgi:hypothetical protein
VVFSHGWPLHADAWNDRARGDVEEETMTITDLVTVQVADLHGHGPRYPVRLTRWPVRREVP